jgi:hypothetical protein
MFTLWPSVSGGCCERLAGQNTNVYGLFVVPARSDNMEACSPVEVLNIYRDVKAEEILKVKITRKERTRE